MRGRAVSVDEVKRALSDLMDKPLSVAVNRGRKKTVRLSGRIVRLFPSVFTIRSAEGDIVSFSYSDVICGAITVSGGA